MAADRPTIARSAVIDEVLGYLNFSSGAANSQFLRGLNELYESCETHSSTEPTLVTVGRLLESRLDELAGQGGAFADAQQARAVLQVALREFPPRYRAFHRDLLFHQPDDAIWRPFFLGRVCEAILVQGPPWNETDRIVDGAIATLNDYVGHRPVAVLRTAQRIEPYPHEWIRPIPQYIAGAGIGVGRYQELIRRALEILCSTDATLLREAQFDPELLDELAIDPRAYDFDHPVNKRPNYHFGQWDPHHLDNQGRYRRFVVQQVTLDVLLERVSHPGDLPPDEVLWEAAAVLAGTMLMASGTSGSGPDAYDSATTLGTLLPRIAAYRDAFYEGYVNGLTGLHGERLRIEATTGKQPLAGARQLLNQQLARQRASQLEHVHLAQLFARMGYPEAALRQAQIVPVASARMSCEIQCRLTAGHVSLDAGDLAGAAENLGQIEDFLHRAIQCGALVDPWNLLGFQGNFSLFPSPENSVPDHRIDELIELIEQILALYARLWSEAAARDERALEAELARRMQSLAEWWDKFAPTSVEGIEGFSGGEAYDSAREVADAMRAFHHAGAAAGDIAFWRKRVAHFNSAKAYALVVGALVDKPDPTAAMALLMQWLSQMGMIALRQGDYSFHALARRWLAEACLTRGNEPQPPEDRQALVRRFFELLEANAEDAWQVPSLELLGADATATARNGPSTEEDNDDEDNVYGAAYDEMVYIDSTADGVEADMLESGGPAAADFELEAEARRVGERLELLRTIASLWREVALAWGPRSSTPLPADVLAGWLSQATSNRQRLVELLASVEARGIPAPSASRDSLLEFDRRRGLKDALVEKIVATAVETADAARLILAALSSEDVAPGDVDAIGDVLRAVTRGDAEGVRVYWPKLMEHLRSQPILYVPLNKGGDATRLAETRSLQQTLRDLVDWLPRLGLVAETCRLLEAARLMESDNPVGPGAISEYDRLFLAGYEAIVESLVDVSSTWPATDAEPDKPESDLVECLEQVTESLLKQWLAHSRTLRLSVLERVADDKAWQALVSFIERYGRDLFTQRFLHPGNLRAILHQGVDRWLAKLEEQPEQEERLLVVEELGGKLPRADAVKHLSLVIEAIVENYAEYRDYNSTTTQSDRGEMIYTLLDFLRLRVHYDRVAWHLKPVLAAHSILVRRGRSAAAENWRQALLERTAELADTLQNRYATLRKKYAMRLPTVADRVGERFIRPLTVDRVRALVKPAMNEARRPNPDDGSGSSNAFEQLQQETDELTQEPTGVGLDVPAWLAALEQEVEHEQRTRSFAEQSDQRRLPLAQAPLTMEGVQQQLTGWEQHPN